MSRLFKTWTLVRSKGTTAEDHDHEECDPFSTRDQISELKQILEQQTKTIDAILAEQVVLREQNQALLSKLTSIEAFPTTFDSAGVVVQHSTTQKSKSGAGKLMAILPTPLSVASSPSRHRAVGIEMAAMFTRSKIASTLQSVRETECPPSHTLVFYYTSRATAEEVLSPGSCGIRLSEECGGVALSLSGPDELVYSNMEDPHEEERVMGAGRTASMAERWRSSSVAMRMGESWAQDTVLKGEVTIVLAVPRRLLWPFPLAPFEPLSPSKGDCRGPFRVLPQTIIASLSRDPRFLSMAHMAKRAYQLHSSATAEEDDPKDDDNLSKSEHRTTTVTHATRPSSYESYLAAVASARARAISTGESKIVLYHYTSFAYAESILAKGIRMSTQGQGDGGCYFSSRGPASYGYGMEREYETNLIVDCYGQERLDEYLGQGRLSLVLVCIVEGGVLTQAPGGRDNALMVPKEFFNCVNSGHEDGSFYLPPACIHAALLLDPASPPPFVSVDSNSAARLVESEADNDRSSFLKYQDIDRAIVVQLNRNQLARIPLTVPFLPTTMIARQEIFDELKASVLQEQPSTCFRTVAVGAGGMGKTTLCAALVNDHEVRSAFDSIVWISVGQKPNISTLDEEIYVQLHGSPFPPQLQHGHLARTTALEKAAADKRVLLVLNDLWEVHEGSFSFLDRHTSNHILASSRVSRLFKDDARYVQLGALEHAPALSLLLADAGIDEVKFLEKAESKEVSLANEIVELTGRLPLVLSIAAGLVESHGSEITPELVAVMKYDGLLRSSSGTSLEDNIIAASLNSLKGRSKKMSTACLYLFVVFREDENLPAALFDLLSSYLSDLSHHDMASPACQHAQHLSNGQSGAKKHTVRGSSMWDTALTQAKVLIQASTAFSTPYTEDYQARKNKSVVAARKGLSDLLRLNLVSGSLLKGVNVHDIVRTHVLSQHNAQQLAAKHGNVVARLLRALLMPQQHDDVNDDLLDQYIRNNLWHHMRCSLQWEGRAILSAKDPCLIVPAADYLKTHEIQEPPDAWFNSSRQLVQASLAVAMGEANLIGFSQKLEKGGNLAAAARCFFLASMCCGLVGTGESAVSSEREGSHLVRAVDLLEACEDRSESSQLLFEFQVLTAASSKLVFGSPESARISSRRKKIFAASSLCDSAQTFGVLASKLVEVHFDALHTLGFAREGWTHDNKVFESLIVDVVSQCGMVQVVCLKAAEAGSSEAMKLCYSKLMPSWHMSWMAMIASHQERQVWEAALKTSKGDLEEIIAKYDFERDHAAYKSSGARVDFFLQGCFVAIVGMVHCNKSALHQWLQKVAHGFSIQHVNSAGLNLECIIAIQSAAPVLLAVCGEEPCRRLLTALGMYSEATFLEVWNSPFNVLRDSVQHMDVIVKLLLFLSSPSTGGGAGGGGTASFIADDEMNAWMPSPETLAAADRTWSLQHWGTCSAVALGAQSFERLGRFDDATATARLGLAPEQCLRKHNAIVECHRVLGRVALVQGESAEVARAHFRRALLAAQASCLPFLVHLTQLDLAGSFGDEKGSADLEPTRRV